jgi:hypothetical protein
VLAEGTVVGRIFKANAAPVGAPWMWTLAFGHRRLSISFAPLHPKIRLFPIGGVPVGSLARTVVVPRCTSIPASASKGDNRRRAGRARRTG